MKAYVLLVFFLLFTIMGCGDNSGESSTLGSVFPANPNGNFTLGSSIKDVTSIHGTPNSVSSLGSVSILRYGSDDVTLTNGIVTSFTNNGGTLHVKMVAGNNTTGATTVVAGVTMDDVIKIKGTPTSAFSSGTVTILRYGSLDITLTSGKVTSIMNNSGT